MPLFMVFEARSEKNVKRKTGRGNDAILNLVLQFSMRKGLSKSTNIRITFSLEQLQYEFNHFKYRI